MGATTPILRPLTVPLPTWIAFAVAGALCGCVLGPRFVPPTPPAAKGYAGAGDKAAPEAVLSENTPAGAWWKALGSPALDEVMARALAHNQTVAAAQATLEKARDEAQR